MSCQSIRRDLLLLGREELDPRREFRIVAHLEACADCSEAAALETRLDDLLAGWRDVEPRRDIAPAVLHALAKPDTAEAEWRRLVPRRGLRPAAAAAAILLAATAAGLVAWTSRGAQGPTPASVRIQAFGAEPLPLASMGTGIPVPPRDPFRPR